VLPVTPFHAAGTSFLGALGIGISQSIWNYSGWDNASTLGGEIEQAGRTYPRALARTLPLVTVVYLLAIVPALAVTDWRVWRDGAWPDIAAGVLGPWLAAWLAAAGGRPRGAVIASAVAYAGFVLLTFGGLLAADVLLYTAALALEFAALIRLRRREPGLRGSFRVPVGVPVLAVLAALPVGL